jgi:hypothetical protein
MSTETKDLETKAPCILAPLVQCILYANTTLYYAVLHCTTLHYTALHCTNLHVTVAFRRVRSPLYHLCKKVGGHKTLSGNFRT